MLVGVEIARMLSEWINDHYLRADVQLALRERSLARPSNRYVLLDNVFRPERVETMAKHHFDLCFRDDLDRHGKDGEILPYDASMKTDDPGRHRRGTASKRRLRPILRKH